MLPTEQYISITDIQDQYSMSFVRGIISAAGYNCSRPDLDRKSDDFYIEYPNLAETESHFDRLKVQVKCTYANNINNDGRLHYPLPIKNYDDLRLGRFPSILVVVHVPDPNSVEWIRDCNDHTIFRNKAYWFILKGLAASSNEATVTIRIPIDNLFTTNSVRDLMNQLVFQGSDQI